MLSPYYRFQKELHTCDVKEYRTVTSYDGAMHEVTDLRDWGDVRGSPLAVIIVLERREGTYQYLNHQD